MNVAAMIGILIMVPTICVACSAYIVYSIVAQIKCQIRLHGSITLVELKSRKVHYYVFAAILVVVIVYSAFQIFDPRSPDTTAFATYFGFEKWHTNIALSAILLCSVCLLGWLVSVIVGKCAVVDKGIYTGFRYIEWHYLYDYIIDMHNSAVVLSTNKSTFLTLFGTTPPLKVAKNDIQKLIFILNKNKNKFNQSIE